MCDISSGVDLLKSRYPGLFFTDYICFYDLPHLFTFQGSLLLRVDVVDLDTLGPSTDVDNIRYNFTQATPDASLSDLQYTNQTVNGTRAFSKTE